MENWVQATHTICKAISAALQKEYVSVAAPTGFLASTYHGKFTEDTFSADTIHGLFKYPVNPTERPQINWQLVARLQNTRLTKHLT